MPWVWISLDIRENNLCGSSISQRCELLSFFIVLFVKLCMHSTHTHTAERLQPLLVTPLTSGGGVGWSREQVGMWKSWGRCAPSNPMLSLYKIWIFGKASSPTFFLLKHLVFLASYTLIFCHRLRLALTEGGQCTRGHSGATFVGNTPVKK